MSQSRIAQRPALFELAVEALQNELSTRLSQLHSRKLEVARLQQLEEHLCGRAWRARADVATPPHAGVVFRLWVTVGSSAELSALLRDIGGLGIDVARQEHQDVADTIGYELALSDRMKVLMRVAIPSYSTRGKVAA